MQEACHLQTTSDINPAIKQGQRKDMIFSLKGFIYEAPYGFFTFSMKKLCLLSLPLTLVMNGALM